MPAAAYPAGRLIRTTVQQDLLAMFLQPYAAAFTRAVDHIVDAHGRAVTQMSTPTRRILCRTSFMPKEHGPWSASGPMSATRRRLALRRHACSAKDYGKNPAVSSLTVEIRRDVYFDEELRPLSAAGSNRNATGRDRSVRFRSCADSM